MGNTAGILQLKFSNEQGRLESGGSQTIKGCVSVDINSIEAKFPGEPLDFQVKIRMVGKELSKIVIGASARKAERTLLFQQKQLHHVTSNETWASHRWHDFTFEMEIPKQMPGSFRCDEGGGLAKKSYAALAYYCAAELKMGDKQVASSFANQVLASLYGPELRRRSIVAERPIVVQAAPIPPIVVPYFMQPTSHIIKTFGVKPKGHILFGLAVADTHVGPGESLELSFACRNHSSVAVCDVYLKLVETISWRLDNTKQVKTVETILVNQIEPMCIPQQRDLWYQESFGADIDRSEDSFISLYHELKGRQTCFRVQVPATGELHDDYAGPLVRCTHHLEIRIKTEDHVDDPRATIPLQLKQFCLLEEASGRRESRFLSRLPEHQDTASIRRSLDLNFSERAHHSGSDLNALVEEEEDRELSALLLPPEREIGFSNLSGISKTGETSFRDSRDIVAPVLQSYVSDISGISETSLRETRVARSRLSDLSNKPDKNNPFGDTRDMLQAEAQRYLSESYSSTDESSFRATRDREESPESFQIIEDETPLSILIAGGRVRLVSTSLDNSSNLSVGSVAGSISFPPLGEAAIPSFPNLLDEMLVSVDDFDIVCAKLENPEWRPIFFDLTPEEFGSMIAHVNLDHDQPKVAAVVAGQIYLESIFTVQHVIQALRNGADWTRSSLVQRLMPFCSNLVESYHDLTHELTPWELTVLASDLESALSSRT